jgi:hypothetical protein
MALTAEQQAQVDISDAMEATRHAYSLSVELRRSKLEAVRLAKEVLIENSRSKAVDARDVTAADITAFANTLVTYIQS